MDTDCTDAATGETEMQYVAAEITKWEVVFDSFIINDSLITLLFTVAWSSIYVSISQIKFTINIFLLNVLSEMEG